MIRNDSRTDSEDANEQSLPFEIRAGAGSVEVALADGAEDLIGSLTDGVFTSHLASTAKVALRMTGGSVEVWSFDERHVVAPRHLGSVPNEEAHRYLPFLRAAERVGQVLVCPAVRMDGPDGRWHLHVRLPLTNAG